MKVIISILHYKNQEDTKKCLKSLDKIDMEGVSVKTIVVNNSGDKNLDLGKLNNINLEILETEKNLGFTGGHNLVYKKNRNKDFDFFLLLNNDCIVDKNFLVELMKPFDDNRVGGTVSK